MRVAAVYYTGQSLISLDHNWQIYKRGENSSLLNDDAVSSEFPVAKRFVATLIGTANHLRVVRNHFRENDQRDVLDTWNPNLPTNHSTAFHLKLNFPGRTLFARQVHHQMIIHLSRKQLTPP